jgi:tetratricopeptide (TPR) repeat protein
VAFAALTGIALLAGAAVWWCLPEPPDADGLAAREDSANCVRGAAESAGRAIDPEKLATANNRGAGLMEQFQFHEALRAFEAVVEMAPDWIPGRINLGIALLNGGGMALAEQEEHLKRTREVFKSVLRLDPDNKHAHHCLGVLLMYRKHEGKGIEHFEAVTRLDPGDPCAWAFLGTVLPQGLRRQESFGKALKADPYHEGALYVVMLQTHESSRKRALLDEFMRLKVTAEWHTPSSLRYGEMGKYAEVIDSYRSPAPQPGRRSASSARRSGPASPRGRGGPGQTTSARWLGRPANASAAPSCSWIPMATARPTCSWPRRSSRQARSVTCCCATKAMAPSPT